MPVCAGIKRTGGRCTATVGPGETHCYHHDPSRAEERRRAASRAGKSKPSREIAGVKGRLKDLAEGVLAGELERADAIAAGQLFNVWLRATEVERRIRETEELEERLEALERAREPERRKSWGT